MQLVQRIGVAETCKNSLEQYSYESAIRIASVTRKATRRAVKATYQGLLT